MGDDLGLRLGRPLGSPGLVEGIGGHRLQPGAGLGCGRLELVQRLGAVQARIVADLPPRLGRFLEVAGDAAVDEIADLEQAAVDLVADLQGVAAVDKDGGLVLEDHRRAGRAGEAGGPGQAIVGGRQIFVLVLVLVRDEEAVDALAGHGGADQQRVLAAEGRIGGFVEGLAHGPRSNGDDAGVEGEQAGRRRA